MHQHQSTAICTAWHRRRCWRQNITATARLDDCAGSLGPTRVIMHTTHDAIVVFYVVRSRSDAFDAMQECNTQSSAYLQTRLMKVTHEDWVDVQLGFRVEKYVA